MSHLINSVLVDNGTQQERDEAKERESAFNEKAEEIARLPVHHPIAFGRWLLKYAYHAYDDELLLTWEFEKRLYDTDELYKIFCERFV